MFHNPVIVEKKKKRREKKITYVEGQTSLATGAIIPEMIEQRERMWWLVTELKDRYFDFKLQQAILTDVVLIDQGKMNATITACSIQRYGDSKLSIRSWWLNLLEGYDPDEDILEGEWSIYHDAPRWDDYNYVSYWQDPEDQEEIIRFIKDRAKWAIPHCKKDLLETYLSFRNCKQEIKTIAMRLKEAKMELKVRE